MLGGIDGELNDANIIFSGVSIHNVLMGCNFLGEGGTVGLFVPFYKVCNVQVYGKVTYFEFELAGLMCRFYLKESGKIYFILHND